jgi:hypothetical protein
MALLLEFVWRYKIAGFDPPEREVEVQSVSHDSLIGAMNVENTRKAFNC